MQITKLLTNKGEFDCNLKLAKLLKEVKKSKETGELLELDRGDVGSRYQGSDCTDSQKIFIDLSVVEIYGYSTHDLSFPE